eukprot:gene409-6822_t
MKNIFGSKPTQEKKSSRNNMTKQKKKKSFFDSEYDIEDSSLQITTKDEKKYYSNFSHKNLITDIIVTDKYLFTSSMDKNICVWDKYNGKILKLLVGHQASVRCIKNIKEKTVVSGGDDGVIKIWDVQTEECLQTIEYSKTEKITSLSLNVVDQLLLFGTSEGKLLAIDWETKKFITNFSTRKQHTKTINYIYNTDSCVYTGSSDGYVKAWDTSDGSLIEMKTFSQPIFKLASINDTFFIQHHTSISVSDSKNDWNCSSPFLSLCDFTITENNLLLGWNRVKAEMELWNVEPRDLLYNEKIEGGMFIKKIKYDPQTGVVYFAKNQTVSFIQLDLEKIQEGMKVERPLNTPNHVTHSDVFDYCVHTLMFSNDIVSKTIDECVNKEDFKEGMSVKEKIDTVRCILMKDSLDPMAFTWRDPMKDFSFLIREASKDDFNLYSEKQKSKKFNEKVKIFYQNLQKVDNESISIDVNELNDCYSFLLKQYPDDLKKKFEVKIDSKKICSDDFYLSIWKDISKIAFIKTSDYTRHPNPQFLDYSLFKAAGRLLGHCIFQRKVPLKKPHFSGTIFKAITCSSIYYEDLETLDRVSFWKTEQILKNDNVNLLDLKFEEDEKKIHVTNSNKVEYVKNITLKKIYLNIKQNIDSLLDGLFEIIPMKHFLIFDEFEIEILLCGSGLDKIENPIKDWQENTKYHNGYSKNSQIIIWFWEIVEDYGALSVAKLLQFVTGTSSLSSKGFRTIEPRFKICKLFSEEVGIIAHRDLNRIDIPEYKTKNELELEMKKALKI